MMDVRDGRCLSPLGNPGLTHLVDGVLALHRDSCVEVMAMGNGEKMDWI